MEIEQIPISKIKPYWRNPRKNEEVIEELKKSIEEFGFNVPLVLDKKYVIITGHSRYKALLQLGKKKVPCIIKDLSEKAAKEYRITDNRLSELSSWNLDYLQKEMMDLDSVIGFSDSDIENILKIDDVSEITQDIINKKQDELDNRFSYNASEEEKKEFIEFICPNCLKEFKLKRNDVINELERI